MSTAPQQIDSLHVHLQLSQRTINSTAKILSKDKDLYLGHTKPSVLVNYKLKSVNKNKTVDFYKQDLQRSEIFLTFFCLLVIFYNCWMAHWPWYIILSRFSSLLCFLLASYLLNNKLFLSQFYTFKIVQQFDFLTIYAASLPLKCYPQFHKKYIYFTCQVSTSQQMPSCSITNDDYTRGHCQRHTVISLMW